MHLEVIAGQDYAIHLYHSGGAAARVTEAQRTRKRVAPCDLNLAVAVHNCPGIDCDGHPAGRRPRPLEMGAGTVVGRPHANDEFVCLGRGGSRRIEWFMGCEPNGVEIGHQVGVFFFFLVGVRMFLALCVCKLHTHAYTNDRSHDLDVRELAYRLRQFDWNGDEARQQCNQNLRFVTHASQQVRSN